MSATYADQSIERLKNAADRLLSTNRPAGSQLEVYASSESERRLVFENDDLSVVSETSGDRFGLRLLHNEHTGFATTNSAESGRLLHTLHEAESLAATAPPSPFDALAVPTEAHRTTVYNLDALHGRSGEHSDDFAGDDLPFEAMQRILAEAKRDARVAIDRVEFSFSDSVRTVVNSHGIHLTQKEQLASWFIMGMARDGAQVTSFDYDGGSAATVQELFEDITRRVADFRDSVIGSLNPRKGRTYKGPVLLHPYAVLDLLVGTVSFNAKSRAHLDGISPWVDRYAGDGRLTEPVAHPSLLLYEDPHDLSRPAGTRFFDREGNFTARHEIVKDGRLIFLAENCHTAKRSGRAITGNATGDGRSLPDHGFSNLTLDISPDGIITPQPLPELLRTMKEGLLLKRFSGNEDPISGRFSGVAKNSRWVENGEICFGVQEVMVSGDLFGLLRDVIAASTERMVASGGWSAPYLLVDGCSVVFD